MIDALLRAAFARPFVVAAGVIALALLGVSSFAHLRRDVFPDLSAPVFNVIVQNPALSAEELETGIAIPVETAMSGLAGVKRVRSTSTSGVVQVSVEFDADADYWRSRQLVAEHLGALAHELPPGSDAPLLSSLTGRLNEVLEFTLEVGADAPGATPLDAMALRDLAEGPVKNRLAAVAGVASIDRLGGGLRQLQVQLDPTKMATHAVTLDDVLRAVDAVGGAAGGGFFVDGPLEWSVRVDGRAQGADDVDSVVVARHGDVAVRLGDVAHVVEAPAFRRGLAVRAGHEVVSCRVIKQFGADTRAVSRGVRDALASLQPALPAGVTTRVVYDQALLIDDALGGVGRAVLLGAFFVVLVIALSLGNARAALIVTLSLPLSLAISGVVLDHFGVGLNTMTLGGLAIAVGLLVDAAIIMVENIVHRLDEARRAAAQPGEAGSVVVDDHAIALAAAVQVGRPIAFATAVVITVFLPLLSMSGIEGRMYAPLAFAVTGSMGASLVLALSVTPVAAAWLLSSMRTTKQTVDAPRLLASLRASYARVLDGALAHPRRVVVVTVVVGVPALLLAPLLGGEFMPSLDEGALMINSIAPPEASLETTDALNRRAEALIAAIPEVEDVVRRTGRGEETEDAMPHSISDVLVVLKRDRARSAVDVEHDVRDRLARLPGLGFLFTTPLLERIDESIGGTPADLSVRVFGPDLDVLADLGGNAAAVIAAVDGVTDVRPERADALPQVDVHVLRDACARRGVTPGAVVDAVRTGLVGAERGELQRGDRRIDVVVVLGDTFRNDLAALRALAIDTPSGPVRLDELARVEQQSAPAVVRRESGSRRVAVDASVVGRDLQSTVLDVRHALAAHLRLPTGYFVDVGGKIESQERAQRALAFAGVVAATLVIALLSLALSRARDVLVLLVSVPVAVTGGVIGLFVVGETWNVSSLVGVIGLFGIAVQNGLVLITQVRELVDDDGSVVDDTVWRRAVRTASLGRVRPKLMTAATAILGLLPMLALHLHGTEIERPLAVAMASGLVSSTVFTLIVLPALLVLVGPGARPAATTSTTPTSTTPTPTASGPR
jgi:cobalt-zinc-cadmium resistance protein CzcA